MVVRGGKEEASQVSGGEVEDENEVEIGGETEIENEIENEIEVEIEHENEANVKADHVAWPTTIILWW